MTILLISDTHSNPATIKILKGYLEQTNVKFDLALGSGDLTNPGYEDFLDDLVSVFKEHNIPFWCVFGNFDSEVAIKKMDQYGINLNNQVKKMGGYKFTGIGYGAVPKNPEIIKDAILVTHEPPFLRQGFGGQATLPLKNNPKIHISGHLHNPAFAKRLGSTLWIQVPTLQKNKLGILRLPVSPAGGPETKVEFV